MNDTSRQHFPRAALATAVATALLPGMAHGAAAGRVDFAYGDVKSVDTAGAEQRLRKGSQINPGDTIVTARGRAQIRFTDGARTSLLPNTEFKVETYEYEEAQPQEAKGFFSLLKGGLRTITGAIGRLRQDAYQVSTPVATIGIRGTEYLVVLGNSANLWVGAGAIVACNSGGCSRFENGESGYVPSATAKPVHTDQKPDDSTGDVDTNEYSAAEDVDEDGTPDVLQAAGLTGFDNGSFYALAVSAGDGADAAIESAGSSPGNRINATFTDRVALASYTGDINGSRGNATFTAATDGTVGWGHWLNGVISTDLNIDGGYGGGLELVNLSGSEAHHYAIGIPTADMPTSGTASFQLIGAGSAVPIGGTPPTYANGNGEGVLTSASLNVNFGSTFSSVEISLGVRMDTPISDTFNVNNALTGFSGSSFSYSGSSTTTGTACSFSCSAYVEGFFAGSGASRAGIAYKLSTDNGPINGAAGLINVGPGTPIMPPT